MSTNQQDPRLDDSGEPKSEEMMLAEEQILLCKERMRMREIQERLVQRVEQLVLEIAVLRTHRKRSRKI